MRRQLLRAALGVSTAIATGGSTRDLLAAWPEAAFGAHDVKAALKALFGSAELTPSSRIKLMLPRVAENGAIVPLTVRSELEGVESITLVALKNPRPLTSNYLIPKGTLAYVSTRIKMQESAEVWAVVKAKGMLYCASRRVKVAVGGCG
jgi:sulfur-oxidizing protein SoxY